MRLGTIDPGEHQIAFAVSENAIIVDAGLYRIATLRDAHVFCAALNLDAIIVEQPQVYRGARGKGDPNDLIRLANVVGACASACARSKTTLPSRWKGQVPKKIHHERVLAELERGRELAMVLSKIAGIRGSDRHNVFDAIGLNLWSLRRLG